MSSVGEGATAAAVERIADRLARARRVLAITGAGLSADSGLPVYREVGGLHGDAPAEDGVRVEDALSAEMLRWRPDLCWKHVRQLEKACRGAEWNRGHQVLQEMEQFYGEGDFLLLTQNVDGLHRSAGSRALVEIHGDLESLRCVICGREESPVDYDSLPELPECPDCGGLFRPAVVLFDELLPMDGLRRVDGFCAAGVDVCLSIGTSSLFAHVAGPLLEIRRRGGYCVEINPGESAVSDWVQERLPTRAAAALDAIWNRVLGVPEDGDV